MKFLDDQLTTKTTKITSLENLYIYDCGIQYVVYSMWYTVCGIQYVASFYLTKLGSLVVVLNLGTCIHNATLKAN